MPKTETKFGAQLAVKVTPEMLDAFVKNASELGSTKDIVLRELVRAFNSYCEGGRRPTFPFRIASPGYAIVEGRIVDMTPMAAEEKQAEYGVKVPKPPPPEEKRKRA